MTKVMANSPALLKGYLALNGAIAGGTLPAAVRERLAITTAQRNGCEYCLSAHTYIGANLAKVDGDWLCTWASGWDRSWPSMAGLAGTPLRRCITPSCLLQGFHGVPEMAWSACESIRPYGGLTMPPPSTRGICWSCR